MPNTSDPTDELRAFFRDQAPEDDHPAGERLVAYHERRLPPEEQEAMRRHLAACPDCAAQLLELAALVGSETPPGPALLPAEMEAAWARFAAGTKTAEPAAAPLPFRAPRPAGRPTRSSSRWAWGLAALLAVTTAGLSALALHQGRLLRDQDNLPTVSLLPDGMTRNGSAETGVLTFEPNDQRGTLLLTPPDDPAGALTHVLDFVDESGRVVASRQVVVKKINGTTFRSINLEISRSSLPPGRYLLELRGRPHKASEQPTRYHLVIRLL